MVEISCGKRLKMSEFVVDFLGHWICREWTCISTTQQRLVHPTGSKHGLRGAKDTPDDVARYSIAV